MKSILLTLYLIWSTFHQLINAQSEDYTYYESIDKYYKFHRTKQTWYDARIVCQNESATLAMPRSTEEMNVISNYFVYNLPAYLLGDVVHKNNLLLGFHDHFNEGEYITLQGEPIQYYFHKWAPNSPDNAGNKDCGSMYRVGLLTDYPCNVPGIFVCQKDGLKEIEKKSAPSFSLDPAYKCDDNMEMCYKLHLNPKNWVEARLICSTEGGRLAIIKNQNIEQFLVKMFNNPDDYIHYVPHVDYALIGFHDIFSEGKYTTLEDKDINHYGYVNWMKGQPDQYAKSQNCGSMNRMGAITDFVCSDRAVFICERPKRQIE